MADQGLDRLKLERTQLRRKFTENINKIESLFVEEDLDTGKLDELYLKAADKAERLFKIDQLVSDILFSIVKDEEVLANEYDVTESYREKWVYISNKKEELLTLKLRPIDRSVTNSIQSSSFDSKRIYRLPKLEIEKFDGSIKNWIKFWAQFRKIHEDESLDEEDKFQYLLQSTLKGSPARELLESFPPSSANYSKAISQLKIRFGRDELLIELYVRELLKLVLTQVSSSSIVPLRSLYDKLETQLRSLESLGVTSDKYACMLFPLVESALPEPVLKEWERQRSRLPDLETEDKSSNQSTHLDGLLKFLRKEVECEERLALAKGTFQTNEAKEMRTSLPWATTYKFKRSDSFQKEHVATAADLVKVKQLHPTCVFCEGQHSSEMCFKARSLTFEDLQTTLKDKGCCFLCLKKGHMAAKCKVNVKCILCTRRHSMLLCPNRKTKRVPEKPEVEAIEQNLSSTISNQVLLQTLKVKVNGEGKSDTVRLLIDTGSQRSYLTKRLASVMDYKPLSNQKLSHALFGGALTEVKTHQSYKVRVESVVNNYACSFEVLDTDVICHNVPVVGKGLWVEELDKKGITLSDIEQGPIDILVGADIAGKLFTGGKRVLSCGLVAIETLLGWTVMGRVTDNTDSYMADLIMLCTDHSVTDLWKLDVLGIEDPEQQKTHRQKILDAEQHFMDTVTILEDGRYEVKLPWLEEYPPLPSNFELAKKRLEITVGKLKSNNLENDYEAVFTDWLNENIIEEVSAEHLDVGHYLPHRPVIKEGSTTRIRPVFDASAHTRGRVSLNQCLEKGVNLIELIPSILLRFRFDSIGVISDVKKAFLQISINEDDRDVLRFLWTDNEGNLRIFRHRRVVFGVSCSPFLLGAVFKHHLDLCEQRSINGDTEYSVPVIDKLRKSFYVDNCVTSVGDMERLTSFIDEASSIFQAAKFELRGWEYSDPNLSTSLKTPVLGMLWNKQQDTIKINLPQLDSLQVENVTRRTLLSASQKLFDPIGMTSPTTLIPKLLIQQTWIYKGDWDKEVDREIKTKFICWLNELVFLKELEIPRWIRLTEADANYTLHTFCDASQAAYAAVCFLRIEYNSEVMVYLLGAKSRVAPIKLITIPRLELLAATIGARLADTILKELKVAESFYWTDSMTSLAWIKQEEPWGVFVRNRVEEIRTVSDINNWRHVPGSMNPADLASRGCSPKTLMQSKWWEGPSWLLDDPSFWPSSDMKPDEEEVKTELKKTVIANCSAQGMSLTESLTKRCSKYTKMVRVVGWMYRFILNCKNSKNRDPGNLTSEEFSRAETKLLGVVQQESFAGSNDKSLLKLRTFVDSEGLIRLKTKILNREDTDEFRTPIVLPSKNHIVDKLIYEKHCRSCHVMGQGLINLLREDYWVIKARQTVNRVVSECVTCKRYSARSFSVETPPLPENRVKDASVFEVTGTDLCGPLYIMEGRKVWICIFTCAIYRAIHLEIVHSLSTESFMLALRRFIARRGRPSVIYSDNGTNFKGVNNAFRKINWDKVVTYSSIEGIDWRFNPPTGAWWGGFWERLIGILKNMLRKTLGKTCLSEEELFTVVCECESLINSRPITYTSEDNEYPIPITPKMFLQEITQGGTQDCDLVDKSSLSRKLKYRLRLKEDLEKRFRSEYLGQLVQNQANIANSREPVVGEVVLKGSDNRKKLDWPLGVIKNLVYGKDGKCRVVYLKTADGKLCRPVQRVFPLEIVSTENRDMSTSEDVKDVIEQKKHINKEEADNVEEINNQRKLVKTRRGRVVKLPSRFL